MKRTIFIILLFLVVSIGCGIKGVAMGSIEGISKEEAITLAKDFLIEKSLDKKYTISKPYKVKNEIWYRYENGHLGWSKPEKGTNYTEERMWEIIFSPKTGLFQLGQHLSILINQKTGRVEHWGNYKW